MMTADTQQPTFCFFVTSPERLLDRPPLASSMQSFETTLFLLGLARYPHAFVSSVQAIESAIKAGLSLSPDEHRSLRNLLEQACTQLPAVRSFPQKDLDVLRTTRNQIVHYGFSPRDDSVTAFLLLVIAIPLLKALYEGFFAFDLYPSLLPEIIAQMTAAMSAHSLVMTDASINAADYCAVLAHQVRWIAKDHFASHWELEAAEHADEIGLRFEAVDRRKRRAERTLDPSWPFNCPICRSHETFVCKLVPSDLENGRVHLSACVCADCGLGIPGVPFLADTVCADQIAQKSNEILRQYGILR